MHSRRATTLALLYLAYNKTRIEGLITELFPAQSLRGNLTRNGSLHFASSLSPPWPMREQWNEDIDFSITIGEKHTTVTDNNWLQRQLLLLKSLAGITASYMGRRIPGRRRPIGWLNAVIPLICLSRSRSAWLQRIAEANFDMAKSEICLKENTDGLVWS